VKNNGTASASPTVLPAAERRGAERSEAARSTAAANTVAPEPPATPRPDPEVVADAKRRTFTAEYKLKILAEADAAASQPGAIGALQRREGLYSSHLVTWRRERREGILKGLTPHKRGPKSKRNPQEEEMQKLRRENQRLTEQLRKAEFVIDVQEKWRAVGLAAAEGGPGGETLMDAVTHLAPTVGVVAACDSLGVARASFYRQRPILGPPASPSLLPVLPSVRLAPARALSPIERASVLTVLHEERFQDRSPATVQATLLDEGHYLCSTRTMYRILEDEGESRERRDQLVHPAYHKPELLATAPNQLWSWDITKLLGPAKWTYFYLYVILDVFSRYVAGWMVAPRESADHRQTSGSRRPTQHPRRPRPGHDFQAGRLSDGRPRRYQDPQPALCLR
jgi:putative transposase